MQRIPLIACSLIALIISAGSGNAFAEERHREELRHGVERHMVFDGRHGHGQYYPLLGYTLSALPSGSLSIGFGRDRYFFRGGAWYRPGRRGYIVVRPQLGISIPKLPPGYTTAWAGAVAYYYANDVYYAGSPGSYQVVAPPTSFIEQPMLQQTVPTPPPAQPAPATSSPAQSPGMWYYCDASHAYYPYVSECKTGWRAVPATPPK